jgi:hypothetical protein
MFAVNARRVEPWHADAVALFDNLDPRANCDDAADGLMTRSEWELGLRRPVAGRCVKVRVAHTTRLGLNKDLTSAGFRDITSMNTSGLPKRSTNAACIFFVTAFSFCLFC